MTSSGNEIWGTSMDDETKWFADFFSHNILYRASNKNKFCFSTFFVIKTFLFDRFYMITTVNLAHIDIAIYNFN